MGLTVPTSWGEWDCSLKWEVDRCPASGLKRSLRSEGSCRGLGVLRGADSPQPGAAGGLQPDSDPQRQQCLPLRPSHASSETSRRKPPGGHLACFYGSAEAGCCHPSHHLLPGCYGEAISSVGTEAWWLSQCHLLDPASLPAQGDTVAVLPSEDVWAP